jgi:hypothetical protein
LSQTLPTFLHATARQKTAATLHSQKDFRAPTHNPIGRGFCATDVHRLVIQRQIWDFAPKNLAWRKKPKCWRTITRPAIRFFSKVVGDPWLGLRLSRIVGGPGYPRYQPGP